MVVTVSVERAVTCEDTSSLITAYRTVDYGQRPVPKIGGLVGAAL